MRDTKHRFSDTTKTLVMTSSITNDLLGKTIMILIRIKPNILYITVMVTSGCQKHGSRFPVSIRTNICDRFIALCPKLDERNHNKSEKSLLGLYTVACQTNNILHEFGKSVFDGIPFRMFGFVPLNRYVYYAE